MPLILMLHMEIRQTNYFYPRMQRNNWEYQLLTEVYQFSESNSASASDLLRRLNLLDIKNECERQLQGGNFVSELLSFKGLMGKEPVWLPESGKKGVKTPDFYFIDGDIEIPVEVKTLNLPKDQGDRLRCPSEPVKEFTIRDNALDFKKKINDDIKDSINKFQSFDPSVNTEYIYGQVHFHYFPSQNVSTTGNIAAMAKAIHSYASKRIPKNVEVFVEPVWSDYE